MTKYCVVFTHRTNPPEVEGPFTSEEMAIDWVQTYCVTDEAAGWTHWVVPIDNPTEERKS